MDVRYLLERVRATQPQSSALDVRQRRRNVHGAFVAVGAVPKKTRIVLIDDVMTTGSTVREAALALRRAGAVSVEVWCCARAARDP